MTKTKTPMSVTVFFSQRHALGNQRTISIKIAEDFNDNADLESTLQIQKIQNDSDVPYTTYSIDGNAPAEDIKRVLPNALPTRNIGSYEFDYEEPA